MSSCRIHRFPGRASLRGQQQARWSPPLERFVVQGGFPIYGEKSRAGVKLFDRDQNPLYQASYPERVYKDFSSIPPLVVDSLLFIEDRDCSICNTRSTTRRSNGTGSCSPSAGRIASVVDRRFREGGASTLATQIEKFRHSPGGRTPGIGEKFRQMVTASARAYRKALTPAARRDIVTTYLNSTPLRSRPGYGEVIGVAEALWVWYGTDFAEANRVLTAPADNQGSTGAQGRGLSASAQPAARQPPAGLLSDGDGAALAALTDGYLRLLAGAGIIDPALRDAALAAKLHFRAQLPPRPRCPSSGTRRPTPAGRADDLLHLPDLYALDRLDLTGYGTVDTAAQKRVTDVLERLGDPAYVKSLGLVGHNLLGGEKPGRLA